VPPGARAQSYPIVEKNQFVSNWMGDPKRADRSLVFDYPYHHDPKGWRLHIQKDYMLLIDNLMDLSRLGYVHGGATVGGAPDTHVEAKMHTLRTPTGFKFDRWMIDSAPPPTYIAAIGFKGHADRSQETELFGPNTVVQWIGAVEADTGSLHNWKYDGDRNGGFSFRLFHGIARETATTCHYFWSSANRYRQNDPTATDQLFKEIGRTFEPDKTIIEAQQVRALETPDERLIDIQGDAARIHARRDVEQSITQESALDAGTPETPNQSANG
jgi:hypothetical protein